MLPRVAQRLVTWLAFAVAVLVPLLAPSVARAALATCESRDPSTASTELTPVEWVPAPPPGPEACSPHDGAEELGDARVAAMCDDRAASVVAPPLVRGVGDARIDAARGCGIDSASVAIGPGSDEAPATAPAFALVDHAVLGSGDLVPPAPLSLALVFPEGQATGPAGVRQGIDHPPR
jgi:hypothetical protein